MNELIEDIKSLGLKPHMIMMVAGGNPMDPADEDKIAPSLLAGLEVAKKHGVEHVASTSFEEWMKPGAATLTGDAFAAAAAQAAAVTAAAASTTRSPSNCPRRPPARARSTCRRTRARPPSRRSSTSRSAAAAASGRRDQRGGRDEHARAPRARSTHDHNTASLHFFFVTRTGAQGGQLGCLF